MDEHEKQTIRVDPKAVIKLYDSGKMPSQIGVELNISVTEILDVLEKRRKQQEPNMIKLSK
jgi:hypothetical protein